MLAPVGVGMGAELLGLAELTGGLEDELGFGGGLLLEEGACDDE